MVQELKSFYVGEKSVLKSSINNNLKTFKPKIYLSYSYILKLPAITFQIII